MVESLKSTTKYLSRSSSPSPLVEKCIVQMWIVIIRLLEDDDESIRDKTAQVVSVAGDLQTGSPLIRKQPLMVSRALESAFEFLTSHFGTCGEYRDFLLRSIDAGDVAGEEIGKASGARVLFDEEDTNAYLILIIFSIMAFIINTISIFFIIYFETKKIC